MCACVCVSLYNHNSTLELIVNVCRDGVISADKLK